MKILVTGSAGHLGEALVRTLRELRATRSSASTSSPSPFTDARRLDRRPRVVRRCMAGVEAVLHAATLHKPHVATHSRQDFVDTNVTGTLNLLEEAVAAGVRRLRLHQHDQRLRRCAHAAAGRAGRVDDRGRAAGAEEHLRRDQGGGRGPVRAVPPQPRAAVPRPADVALLPGGGRRPGRARRPTRTPTSRPTSSSTGASTSRTW